MNENVTLYMTIHQNKICSSMPLCSLSHQTAFRSARVLGGWRSFRVLDAVLFDQNPIQNIRVVPNYQHCIVLNNLVLISIQGYCMQNLVSIYQMVVRYRASKEISEMLNFKNFPDEMAF
jgi:hypothetical protein